MTSLRLAALASALLAGAAAPAAPATADEPSATGTYTFEADDGEQATWNVVACPGDPPGCIRVAEFGNSKRKPWSGDAHYTVGSWILLVQQPDAILCEDGSTVPGTNTYSWDNATLSGNVSTLSNGACGAKSASLSIPFRLSKTGVVPISPPAPAELPATPPQSPAAEPTGPLPAESAAGQPTTP